MREGHERGDAKARAGSGVRVSALRLVGASKPVGATAHNADAEVAILATVLEAPRSELPKAQAMGLRVEHFHVEANGRVWEALTKMAEIPDATIHPVMVAQWLKDRGWPAPEGGWTGYLARQAHMVAPLPACVELVIELADVRAVQAESEALAAEAKAPIQDRRAWLAAAQERLSARVSSRASAVRDFDAILQEVYADFDDPDKQRKPGEILGYSTGHPSIDAKIGGLVAAELVLLTGAEKSGKSCLGSLWCANAARKAPRASGRRVGSLILQWEDPRQKTIERLVGARGRVDLSRRRTGNWNADDWADFTRAGVELGGLPLKIEDECAPDVVTIGARVRAVRDEWAPQGITLGVVMVDSLQCIRAEGQNREQQLENALQKFVALKRAPDLKHVSWLIVNHTGDDGEMVNARKAPRRWCNTWLDLRVEGKDKEEPDGARPAHVDVKLARDVEWGVSVPLWCLRHYNNLFVDGGNGR